MSKNFFEKWIEKKEAEFNEYLNRLLKCTNEQIKKYFKGLKHTKKVILLISLVTALFFYLGYKVSIKFILAELICGGIFYSIFFVKTYWKEKKVKKLNKKYDWLHELFNKQVRVIKEDKYSIIINSYVPFNEVLKKKDTLENRFNRAISSINKKGNSFRTFIINFDNGKKTKFKKKYYLKDYINQPEKDLKKCRIPFLLGVDENEKTMLADLGKLNHILIAGETDFGKSTCVNTTLQSLQYYNDDILYFLTDFKIVELRIYNKLNNVIFIGEEEFATYLEKLNDELKRRKYTIADAELQNIKQYNKKYPDKKMPYIVFLIDEVSDIRLEAEDNEEVKRNEKIITRILNQGRALGMHVIIATQNPSGVQLSTQVKKGLSTKISFKVVGHIGQDQVGVRHTEKLNRGEFKMLGDDGEVKMLKGFFCDREESWETFNELVSKRGEGKDAITF